MMFELKSLDLLKCKEDLIILPQKKFLINTINAHSYNTAQHDLLFAEALAKGDALIPDGISIVKAFHWKKWHNGPKERVAGADLFAYEMGQLNKKGGVCFFLGSSENVLSLICKRVTIEYPQIYVKTYSPPYKAEFSEEDTKSMIDAINESNPDLLWIGMTAPKQEKWVYSHWEELNINCHCGTIGAVFDFYAGTLKRAPERWQENSLEWLYRLVQEPRRVWRRYIIGNLLFLWNLSREK